MVSAFGATLYNLWPVSILGLNLHTRLRGLLLCHLFVYLYILLHQEATLHDHLTFCYAEYDVDETRLGLVTCEP